MFFNKLKRENSAKKIWVFDYLKVWNQCSNLFYLWGKQGEILLFSGFCLLYINISLFAMLSTLLITVGTVVALIFGLGKNCSSQIWVKESQESLIK